MYESEFFDRLATAVFHLSTSHHTNSYPLSGGGELVPSDVVHQLNRRFAALINCKDFTVVEEGKLGGDPAFLLMRYGRPVMGFAVSSDHVTSWR